MFTPTDYQQKIIDIFSTKEVEYIKKAHSYRINITNNVVRNMEYKECSNEHFDYFIFTFEIINSEEFDTSEKKLSFEDIIQDTLSKTYAYQKIYAFVHKFEYILRFSRTYGNLEYYDNVSSIVRNKHRQEEGRKILSHKKNKTFKIKPNGYALIYTGRMCKYASLKNIRTIFVNEEIRSLVISSHLRGYYKPEDIKQNHNIPNKISKNKNGFIGIVESMATRPIPKIIRSKFTDVEAYYLYAIINENEITKIISYYNENKAIYKTKKLIEDNKLNINFDYRPCIYYRINDIPVLKVIADYMALKLNLITKINWDNNTLFTQNKKTDTDIGYVEDYIRMSSALGNKISLNITSTKRLKFLHDQTVILHRVIGIPKIKPAEYFPEINETAAEIIKEEHILVEKITDSKRLVEESVTMNHCVSSYHGSINRGTSCIYHIRDLKTGEKGTLELHKSSTLGSTEEKPGIMFYVNQFKGIWNSKPSSELTRKINKALRLCNVAMPKDNEPFGVIPPPQNRAHVGPPVGQWAIAGNRVGLIENIGNMDLPF